MKNKDNKMDKKDFDTLTPKNQAIAMAFQACAKPEFWAQSLETIQEQFLDQNFRDLCGLMSAYLGKPIHSYDTEGTKQSAAAMGQALAEFSTLPILLFDGQKDYAEAFGAYYQMTLAEFKKRDKGK